MFAAKDKRKQKDKRYLSGAQYFLLLSVFVPWECRAVSTLEVVAEVNGVSISQSSMEEKIEQRFGERWGLVQDREQRELRHFLLEEAINEELLFQESVVTLKSSKKVIENAKKDPIQRAQLIGQYLETEVYPAVSVSPREVREAYDRSGMQIRRAEERRIRELWWKIDPFESLEERDHEREEAQKIVKAIQSDPSKFSFFARQLSSAHSRFRGGDLGFVTENQVIPPLKVAFQLPKNGFSDLIEASDGFYLVHVEEIHSPDVRSLDFEESKLREEIQRKKEGQALNSRLDSLRQRSRIIRYVR